MAGRCRAGHRRGHRRRRAAPGRAGQEDDEHDEDCRGAAAGTLSRTGGGIMKPSPTLHAFAGRAAGARLRLHRPGTVAAAAAPSRAAARSADHRQAATRTTSTRRVPRACTASCRRVTRDNLHSLLAPRLSAGDLLLNLSVDVSSAALMQLCRDAACCTSTPASSRGPAATSIRRCSPSQRTQLRAARSGARAARAGRDGPTAVLTHGANPGLVSHFVKQALLDIAARYRQADRGAAHARRLGPARAASGRARDPHRRARHAGRQPGARRPASSSTPGRCEAFVDEGYAAGRARLGQPRARTSRRRRTARDRHARPRST